VPRSGSVPPAAAACCCDGPPHYEKLILEHGDEAAIHIGGKGGLPFGQVAVAPAPLGEVPVSEVPEAERQWLRANGIDWDDASA
jgi:hypothetical protein